MNLGLRLLSKYRFGDGCWEHQHPNKDGYAHLKVEGRNIKAHRLMYALFVGVVPDGMDVCHTCDNGACGRWDHLFLGTARDNILDAASKNRLNNANKRKTHCKRGHEFTPENTYTDSRGLRRCRRCHADEEYRRRHPNG